MQTLTSLDPPCNCIDHYKYQSFFQYKRLETFFEEDKDINRNTNINKAYEYGYTKTEIAGFTNLSTKTINTVLN